MLDVMLLRVRPRPDEFFLPFPFLEFFCQIGATCITIPIAVDCLRHPKINWSISISLFFRDLFVSGLINPLGLVLVAVLDFCSCRDNSFCWLSRRWTRQVLTVLLFSLTTPPRSELWRTQMKIPAQGQSVNFSRRSSSPLRILQETCLIYATALSCSKQCQKCK